MLDEKEALEQGIAQLNWYLMYRYHGVVTPNIP